MAETPLTDVIRYLRTSGDSEGFQPDLNAYRFVTFDAGPMSPSEKAFAELAFLMWGELIDQPIGFTSADSANITLNFDTSLPEGISGRMQMRPWTGDLRAVLVNRNTYARTEATDLFDEGRFVVFLHEIGHALGLTHPGAYNGEVGDPDAVSVYPEDTRQYSLMSYRADVEGLRQGDGGPSTPLLHDIAAIQSIYGKNQVTRRGDTTYGFNSNNEHYVRGLVLDPYDFAEQPDGFSFAIYDTGGIDTIDASQFRASTAIFEQGGRFPHQVIDLREGHFSSIGIRSADTIPMLLTNNVSIAYGVTIENAIGGGGNDTITGNDAKNRLVGNDGEDSLYGGRGDDELIGGNDDDNLRGQEGDDILDGGDGSDLMIGGGGNDIFISGRGERDILMGGDGFDTARYLDPNGINYRPSLQSFFGNSTGDVFISIEAFDLTDGRDTFEGREERDVIYGNGGNDTLWGFGDDDLIEGGSGDDTIDGGAGDDNLGGGSGNDTLLGGSGNDQLVGGFGADLMEGGQGGDSYWVDDIGDIVREPVITFGNFERDSVLASIDYTLPSGIEDLALAGFGSLRATGNALGNVLTGNPADNVLDGGAGADTMRGMRGNDVYIVDNVGDVVDESFAGGFADVDTVQSSLSFSLASATAVLGAVENLTLTGSAAITGTGNALDNVLTGNSAANTLTGGDGDDTLIGGGGNDSLNGGADNDTYDYRLGKLLSANLGSDTITDSAGSDQLRLDSMSQVLGGRRSGDDLILTLQQATVTIKGHFSKGQIETLRADIKQVVLANGLIGGNASGIISGSDESETMDGRGGDDFLYGAAGNDVLLGSEGNDLLQGDHGNDLLAGGSGTDTARFTGQRADYDITVSNGPVSIKDRVADRDGSDHLSEVERLAFEDGTLAFDFMGATGQIYALYKALLGRDPDDSGLGYFLRYLERGGTTEAVANAMINASEMAKTSTSNAEFVTRLYQTWLHRDPEKEGFDHWTGRLENAQGERGSTVADFLASPFVLQQATLFAPGDGIWLV